MESIYLIGQISFDAEITYKWREEVENYFRTKSGFSTINPCGNAFNKNTLKELGNGKDVERKTTYKKQGIGLLVPKDYNHVKQSSGAIANMNLYDPQKPTIGTFFEMAWYYTFPEKCVVGIFDGDPKTDLYCGHPFVWNTVNVWVKDHITAAEVINEYYNRG